MANHTSPIDVIILASDGYYAMVRSAPQLCLLLCCLLSSKLDLPWCLLHLYI